MKNKPLYLFRVKEESLILRDVSTDDISQNYDYYMRLSRAHWLKRFFGENKIPRELFQTIVSADVTPDVLQSWFDLGGLNGVYYYCNVVFGDPDNTDKNGIRSVQLRTADAL